MNRDELTELLAGRIINIDDLDGFQYNWHQFAAAELADALWPVLEKVWDDGWSASSNWHILLRTPHVQPPPPNPYTQHSALDTDSDRGHTQT